MSVPVPAACQRVKLLANLPVLQGNMERGRDGAEARANMRVLHAKFGKELIRDRTIHWKALLLLVFHQSGQKRVQIRVAGNSVEASATSECKNVSLLYPPVTGVQRNN